MMLGSHNQFIYSRERRRFGRQCLFSDRTQLMYSIQPSRTLRLSYILRNPQNRGTQYSDQMAYSDVLTENVTFAEHGMYHYEGGWPREININDEEQTLRYRKKIEREDSWATQVTNLIQSAMKVASQNSAVDIYKEFFEDLPEDLGTEILMDFEARPNNIYHDPVLPARPACIIDWSPSNPKRFLAQYSQYDGIFVDNLNVQVSLMDDALAHREATKTERQSDMGSDKLGVDDFSHGFEKIQTGEPAEFTSDTAFFGWDVRNSLKPEIQFDGPEPSWVVRYCPKDENFVAGGFESGKAAVWDSRIGGYPLHTCPLEAAHRDAVAACCWVHSKANNEFYTGSCDGSVKFWDGRDLQVPIHEILLDPEQTDEQSRERAHGATVLEFEYTIPVRFIICSNHGRIFLGNRKGLTPTETLLGSYRIFAGAIKTIERNPHFVKFFLIAGDWCVKVWSEECKGSPTTLTMKKKNEVMCGSWSPARCSLFVTGDKRGLLDFWDLLLHQRQPIFTVNLKRAILSVKFRHDGEYLAVALENGDIHMLEMDQALKYSGAKERALLNSVFEREQHRSKLLEGRVEEIKLKRATESTMLLAEESATKVAGPKKRDTAESVAASDLLDSIEDDDEYKEALRLFKEITKSVLKKRQERVFAMEKTEFESMDTSPRSTMGEYDDD